jgi:tellurium resistance protein TerD
MTQVNQPKPLILDLLKPGEEAPKLFLDLGKDIFTFDLFWESDEDLDAHALLATNSGRGAKITTVTRLLSAYSIKAGGVVINDDGSFSTPEGALTHSGDARTGTDGDGEIITINGVKIPHDVNDIPFFVTIHKAGSSTFASVKNAGIRIKDDLGNVLGEYNLSSQFSKFNAVQMGNLMRRPNGWEYVINATGFTARDFNDILKQFS